jgi:DNA-binding IclR family transcriptional regulator
MQIVETLAEAPEGLSLAALAQRLGIPKTSLLNHLRVMVGTGYVAFRDGCYVLGPAAFRLGSVIAAGSSVLAVLGPVTRQLAGDSGETTLLATLDRETCEAIYIEGLESSQPLRFAFAVGTRRPLYCTSMGRALLAFQPPAFIRRYLAEENIKRVTAHTVTDRGKLKKILAQVLSERLASTLEEHTEGVGGLASPVFDRQGRVSYSIGVAVPAARLERDRQRLSRLVLAAADKASWALGAPAG